MMVCNICGNSVHGMIVPTRRNAIKRYIRPMSLLRPKTLNPRLDHADLFRGKSGGDDRLALAEALGVELSVGAVQAGADVDVYILSCISKNRQKEVEAGRFCLSDKLAFAEKGFVQQALLASKGNRTEAARLLGISRKNL